MAYPPPALPDLVVGTNTYIDLEHANSYMAARVQSDNWFASEDAQRIQALLDACRHIEAMEPAGWEGFPEAQVGSALQPLQWPRYSVPDRRQGLLSTWSPIPGMGVGFFDVNSMPYALTWAQCEEALECLEVDQDAAYHEVERHRGRGIKQLSISRGKSVEYFERMPRFGGSLLSEEAFRLLALLRRQVPRTIQGLW